MNPAYVVNTKTRVVYAYTDDLIKSEDPKFIPYEGNTLPPIDFETGMRLAPKNTDEFINLRKSDADLTEQERIERLAAVVQLVPKEEISEAGAPSLVVMERLSALTGVKRAEVTKAMKLRADKISGRLNKVEDVDEQAVAVEA